jgi:hypothetical protein
VTRPEAALLGRRLDDLLAEAERLVRPVDAAAMAPLRDTAFRVFRLALAFVDGMDRGRLVGEWREERAPDDLQDGASLARYGALVRARVGGWFEGAGPRELERVIEGLDGPRPAAELLAGALDDAAAQLARLRHGLARSGEVS